MASAIPCRATEGSREFPLLRVSSAIDPETLQYNAGPQVQERFQQMTGLLFDMPLVTTLNDVIVQPCPYCSNNTKIPWLVPGGTGWGQRDFKLKCQNCDLDMTLDFRGNSI